MPFQSLLECERTVLLPFSRVLGGAAPSSFLSSKTERGTVEASTCSEVVCKEYFFRMLLGFWSKKRYLVQEVKLSSSAKRFGFSNAFLSTQALPFLSYCYQVSLK